MEKIFAVLNQMEADGVIGRYAIGGAVVSIFWLEPITTKDVDVFVTLPTSPGGTLLTLGPIYEYLLGRGFEPEGQFIVIEGWAVEFVPPGTPLVEEALKEAVERDVNGIVTRVFTAEHLAAICLQVGNPLIPRLRSGQRLFQRPAAQASDWSLRMFSYRGVSKDLSDFFNGCMLTISSAYRKFNIGAKRFALCVSCQK